MSEKKNTIYKGKGYILTTANKEYLDNNKRKKKKNEIKKKTNIFNKFKPVIVPLLHQSYKGKNNSHEKDGNGGRGSEKGRGRRKGNAVTSFNILNEDEINSFLLRNKAFRLTWSSVIEKVQQEIDLEMSKNLRSVFDDIYLHSVCNSEHLPIVLITAGTNLADHEIIIGTLSYELKKWKYHRRYPGDSTKEGGSYICKGEKFEYGKDTMNKQRGGVSLLDQLNYKEGESKKKGEFDDDNDMYVCSLNSSTSNNINSAVYNIYEQLQKKYKKKCESRKVKNNEEKGVHVSETRSMRRRNENQNAQLSSDSEHEMGSIRDRIDKDSVNAEAFKDIETEEFNLSKKTVSLDKIVGLYKMMSELERKEEEEDDKSSSCYEEELRNNENFMIENLDKLKLYNEDNNYFKDGRKKIRIVIIIHDCEYFNINILNGILNVLINLRSDYKLCLSVILGVSTPSFFFSRITSPDTQSKLRIKTVDILNNKLICENICHDLMFGNVLPFVISFRTMVAIRMLLQKSNQSISHLIHILYILSKEFYDSNVFSFLCIPMSYYLNLNSLGQGKIETEYSPYTFVRSYQKSFRDFSKYDMRSLHRKIVSLCYCANLYYQHLTFIKKKYSSVLTKSYYDLHDSNSQVHTPTQSDQEDKGFTLKKKKSEIKKGKIMYGESNMQKVKEEKEKEKVEGEEEPGSIEMERKVQGTTNVDFVNDLSFQNNEENTAETVRKRKSNQENLIDTEKEKKIKVEETASQDVSVEGTASAEESTVFGKSEETEDDTLLTEGVDAEQLEQLKKELIKVKKANEFDRSTYAWQFKAKTINWWYDHPFKDLVYMYENTKQKSPYKNEINKLLEEQEPTSDVKNLCDIENIKDINKNLCEIYLPTACLQLIERRYALTIAINLINFILKIKPEYTTSTQKRFDYFRKLLENYEKLKWSDNKNIVHIEEAYKVVESDVKKCINCMIEIVTPYYFRNQEVLLKMLKEFKKFYSTIYPIVYNLEDYLYVLKKQEKDDSMRMFMNDDFAKSCAQYAVSYSIYYSLLFKLDDLIEMLRVYYLETKNNMTRGQTVVRKARASYRSDPNENVTQESSGRENGIDVNTEEDGIKDKKEKLFKRYLTLENTSLKKAKNMDTEQKVTIGQISDCFNLFLHDYLHLLLLPPMYFHPLAYELIMYRPDKDFAEFMARDIKSEILSTLSNTIPYRTGSLMCSCCVDAYSPSSRDYSSNIVCDNRIYLNPYYDNVSSLEDLVNIYRIYEKCGKTIDLYNFFIIFLNTKVDRYMGYSIEEKQIEPLQNSHDILPSHMLQEYYLRFIIAISTFCSFFKILKPPNVSALLNYDDKDYAPDKSDSKDQTSSDNSITKFLSEIERSLQGCTSKKLLFGKFYYSKTIIAREFHLMRMVQAISEEEKERREIVKREEEEEEKLLAQHKGGKKRKKT